MQIYIYDSFRVTCGNSTRNGIEQPDRFLMVYDLRILRAISPIPIHVPPYQLRFLPSMSSRIAVVSSLGQVQLVDTAALISPTTNMFQGKFVGWYNEGTSFLVKAF